jgi:membrane-associated phospholipid phosphatase
MSAVVVGLLSAPVSSARADEPPAVASPEPIPAPPPAPGAPIPAPPPVPDRAPVPAPAVAKARTAEPSSYALRAEVDVPVLALSAVVGAGWLMRHGLEPAWCAPRCASEGLNAIDKPFAGRYRTDWGTASDIGVAALVAAGLVAPAVDGGFPGGFVDAVVVAETVLVGNALQALSVAAFRRPRPYMYGDEAPIDKRIDGDGALSFFSGHTTVAFASAVSLFSVLHRRHPDSLAPWVALGVGLAAAAFVVTGRVLAGNHFPTDVAAGAVVGSSLGVLVPALHEAGVGSKGAGLRVVPVTDGTSASLVTTGWF